MVCQKVSRGKEREESFTATEYVPLGNSHMKRNTLPRGNGVIPYQKVYRGKEREESFTCNERRSFGK